MFRWNADAVVLHPDHDAFPVRFGDGDDEQLFILGAFIQRILGVTDKIDQNLQDFMFVNHQGRHFLKLADDLDAMAGQCRRINLDGIFHQAGQGHFFDDAGNTRIALLRGDDVLDVIDVFGQLLQFTQSVFLLFLELLGDLNKEFRH